MFQKIIRISKNNLRLLTLRTDVITLPTPIPTLYAKTAKLTETHEQNAAAIPVKHKRRTPKLIDFIHS